MIRIWNIYIVFFLIGLAYSSKNEIRLEIVRSLFENRTDSLLIYLEKGFELSRPYGEHPFSPYEVLAINTIAGNYTFALNVDSLNYYNSYEYKRLISVSRDGLFNNIENLFVSYINSDLHKSRIGKLNLNDKSFLNGLFLSMDSVSQDKLNEYIEANEKYLTNEVQRSYLINTLWYKKKPSIWRFYIEVGGGADVFINGAEKILNDNGHGDMNIRLCIYKLCPEYAIQIVNTESKYDIIQDANIFPKEAGPQLSISKINLGYKLFENDRFENIFFGGIAITSFGIAEKQKDDFDIDDELKGLSIGYNIGTSFSAYFTPRATSGNEFSSIGFGLRLGYIDLNEKRIMDLKGGDLYFSLQMSIKVFHMKVAKYK